MFLMLCPLTCLRNCRISSKILVVLLLGHVEDACGVHCVCTTYNLLLLHSPCCCSCLLLAEYSEPRPCLLLESSAEFGRL